MEVKLSDENSRRQQKLTSEPPSLDRIEEDISSTNPSTQRDAILHLLSQDTSSVSEDLIQSLTNILNSSPQKDSEPSDTTQHVLLSEAAIAALLTLASKSPTALPKEALVAASAYTNPDDKWSSETSAQLASSLLATSLDTEEERQDFIVGPVLQSYLRPIFSKGSGNTSVTAEGRPAAFREPAQNAPRPPAEAAWKEAGPQVVSIFQSAVTSANEATLAKNWPLFIPVLVTLCEDNETRFRLRGLHILNTFLQKCPMDVIRSSGVDAVFQEAVFPTLLFMPNVTPEEESVQLLRAAYKVLLSLALIDSDVDAKKRLALLDKVLREGVLTGYFHAAQHIHIVQVIFESAADVIDGLQIAAVKHLQKLLNLFSSVMTDAFALAYPPAVLAAAKALNTTILNCWPRLAGTSHAEQIVHITSIAWTNLQNHKADEHQSELSSLAKELSRTSELLAALWRENKQAPPKKLLSLLEKQPHLQPLFASLGSSSK
ncbi:hypothetical protein K4F52_006624 [Lecanicillium sp. MT-2017a]|nr:hypothetical protein K4F52_006624 [Lecanicillium sp. MT-2017a]